MPNNQIEDDNILNVKFSDIEKSHANIKYHDEELAIIDDIREIPNIKAFKFSFNIGLLCLAGKIQVDVGKTRVMLTPKQVLVCHSHVMLSNFMTTPDINAKVMCLSDRILKSILQTQIGIWNNALYPNHFYILNVDDTQLKLFDAIRPKFNNTRSPLQQEILICLVRAGFLLMCDLFSYHTPLDAQEYDPKRMDTLFHTFINNIAKKQVKKISVTEYASELCITPKYLSTICHKICNKPPKQLIAEYVTEDIKYYLKNTDLSIKEIAHMLGFDNPSFFGKFVKTHLGTTPKQYRINASKS